MSRIGKKPVSVPKDVKITVGDQHVTVEGPKGKLDLAIHESVAVVYDAAGSKILVTQHDVPGADIREARHHRAMWGTTRNLIVNMIEGVTKGYTHKFQLVGVGYSARIDKGALCLKVGMANELRVPIPPEVQVNPPEPGNIMITGIGQVPAFLVTCHSADKRIIGQFTSSIRKLRPPEPYKGKGIRYFGEEVKRKAGKALAAAGAK